MCRERLFNSLIVLFANQLWNRKMCLIMIELSANLIFTVLVFLSVLRYAFAWWIFHMMKYVISRVKCNNCRSAREKREFGLRKNSFVIIDSAHSDRQPASASSMLVKGCACCVRLAHRILSRKEKHFYSNKFIQLTKNEMPKVQHAISLNGGEVIISKKAFFRPKTKLQSWKRKDKILTCINRLAELGKKFPMKAISGHHRTRRWNEERASAEKTCSR